MFEELQEVAALGLLHFLPDGAHAAQLHLTVGRIVYIVKCADAGRPTDIDIVSPGPFKAVIAIDEDGVK